MTQIEKIRQEIERLKDKYPSWQLKLAMDDLLSFIESLEEELKWKPSKESMEARDLQIGDWVLSPSSSIMGTFTAISKVLEIRQEDVWVQVGIGGQTCSYDEITPIPITPGILGRNFEKKGSYVIYDDYFDLEIREFSDSLYTVSFHDCEMVMPDQRVIVSFVHQLQHALHLLGIEMQIKL